MVELWWEVSVWNPVPESTKPFLVLASSLSRNKVNVQLRHFKYTTYVFPILFTA